MLNINFYQDPMILSGIFKQKCMYGVYLLFQYPFFVMLAITVVVASDGYLATLHIKHVKFLSFALKLSSDNKDFLLSTL